jgi:hypothetical protein
VVVAGVQKAQTPFTQLPLWQSLSIAQLRPFAHGEQLPPQSVSVSVPFLTPSVQLDWQAPEPSQAVPAHSLSGSVPAATGAQVPSAVPVLAALQARHVPAQSVSQQTLSMQKPESHSVPALQGDP